MIHLDYARPGLAVVQVPGVVFALLQFHRHPTFFLLPPSALSLTWRLLVLGIAGRWSLGLSGHRVSTFA